MSRITKGLTTALLTGLLAITSGEIYAQDADELAVPDSEKSLIKRKSIVIVRKRTEEPETPGVKLQNYVLYPAITLTEYYDDNVFATDEDKKDDLVTVITPTIELKSKWTRHAFNLDAGLEAVRHVDLSSENTQNTWLNLDGKYEISSSARAFGGFSYMRDHEDRASVDAAAGDSPAEFDDRSLNAGFSGNSGKGFYYFSATNRELDYDDVDSSLGEIDYDDRDRSERSAGIRFLYRYTQQRAVFAELELDERDYVQTPDNEGNDRNSDGRRYAVGIEAFGGGYVGRVYAGRLERDYKSSEFDDADEFDLGLRLDWKYSDSTQVVFRSVRSIEETVLDGSPGYLMRNSSLRLSHELTAEKSLSFDLLAANADYFSIDRDDDYLNAGVGYRQQLMPNLSYSVDLHHARRDSSSSGEDYRVNQVFLRLRTSI